MPLYGTIVIIKRTGEDGTIFPLTAKECLFGSSYKCDVRVLLPSVAPIHCVVKVTETKEVTISHMDPNHPITLNGEQLPNDEPIKLNSGDIFAISDRTFRFETVPPRRRASARKATDVSDVPTENAQNGEISEDGNIQENGPSLIPSQKATTTRLVSSERKNVSGMTPTRKDFTPRLWKSQRKESQSSALMKHGSAKKLARKLELVPSEQASSKTSSLKDLPPRPWDSQRKENQRSTRKKSSASGSGLKTRKSELATRIPSLVGAKRSLSQRKSTRSPKLVSGGQLREETDQTSPQFAGRSAEFEEPHVQSSPKVDGAAQIQQDSPVVNNLQDSFQWESAKKSPADVTMEYVDCQNEVVADDVAVQGEDEDVTSEHNAMPLDLISPEEIASAKTPMREDGPLNSQKKKNRMSALKTPKFTGDQNAMSLDLISPEEIASIKKPMSEDGPLNSQKKKNRKSALKTPKFTGDQNAMSLDLISPEEIAPSKTPMREDGPLNSQKTKTRKSALKTPKFTGVKKLFQKTELATRTPRMAGTKRLFAQRKSIRSPKLAGVAELLREEKPRRSARFAGLPALFEEPKIPATPKLNGIAELMREEKQQESPMVNCVQELFKGEKVMESPNLAGVKKLLHEKKPQHSPRLGGISKLFREEKIQKSPELGGISKMFKEDKTRPSPRLAGVRRLMKEPKPTVSTSPSLSGIHQLFREFNSFIARQEGFEFQDEMDEEVQIDAGKLQPKRGRKRAAATQKESTKNDKPVDQIQMKEAVVHEEKVDTEKPKPKRGRKAVAKEEDLITKASLAMDDEPATVPKRTRKQTVAQVQVEEVVVPVEKVDVEKPKRGRGRKLVIANEENLITNSSDEPATVPKRARRQAVQLQEEDVINPVEKVDIEKPKRGRKLAIAKENLITNIAENPSDEPVTVPKRARKLAVQVQEEEVVVPVEKMDIEKPKRGRKLPVAKENLITDPIDEPVTVPKRARKQAVAQIQEEEVINPVEKPKRGRKPAGVNQVKSVDEIMIPDDKPMKSGRKKPIEKSKEQPEAAKESGGRALRNRKMGMTATDQILQSIDDVQEKKTTRKTKEVAESTEKKQSGKRAQVDDGKKVLEKSPIPPKRARKQTGFYGK